MVTSKRGWGLRRPGGRMTWQKNPRLWHEKMCPHWTEQSQVYVRCAMYGINYVLRHSILLCICCCHPSSSVLADLSLPAITLNLKSRMLLYPEWAHQRLLWPSNEWIHSSQPKNWRILSSKPGTNPSYNKVMHCWEKLWSYAPHAIKPRSYLNEAICYSILQMETIHSYIASE